MPLPQHVLIEQFPQLCHSEERSDVAIRMPKIWSFRDGLPHQCAHWFTMTCFWGEFIEKTSVRRRRANFYIVNSISVSSVIIAAGT